MSQPSIQTSFAAGELAPALFGHVDFSKFAIGASTMRNMYVGYKGGSYSRAGTAFVGYSKQIQNSRASGSVFFAINPINGDTVTLNGIVWTFVSGTPSGNQIQIGGTAGFTIVELQMALSASIDPALTVATYTFTTGGGGTNATLLISYNQAGSHGNTYTLAASRAAVSAATLTGGTSAPPRLIPFQFNLNQGLVLEFGNFYMRVISNGAFVTETPVAITAATRSDPATITTAVTAAVGDWVFITGVQGMTQLNGHSYIVSAVVAGVLSLTDVFGNNIDSSGFGVYTGAGTAARIYTLTTPYAAADLDFLKYTQSADVMSLALRNQNSGAEYAPYDLSRLADDNWTLTVLSTGASIGPPGTTLATANQTTGLSGLTNFQYCWTAIDANTGQESIAGPIASVSTVNIAATAGSITTSLAVGKAGARYYNIYKAGPAFQTVVPIGNLFGFAGSTFGTQFVDSNIVQDYSTVPPLNQNPFAPGQALSVTVLTSGSGLLALGYTINTSTGSGAVGYGVVVDGAMTAFVFTDGGKNYAQTDTITFFDSDGTIASGDILFAFNPSNGDTVTLNGVVWTFVSGSSTGNQTHIGSTLAFTLNQLIGDVTASSVPALTVATYTLNLANTDVIITYKTTGAIGNSYTLAASVATPSGGTLTGGTGGVAPTGTLVVGPESGTYPSVVAYFQERRVYANTANQPDTYFMSQPGAFKNFDLRIPTLDSDAIEGTPWSVAVDGIQFLVPVLGGMVALTGQAAYQVVGTGGSPTNPQPVTPSSQQAMPQVYNGCHYFVPPVKIDYDIYYLQAKGSVIRSLSYNFFINVFTGIDVTFLSSQLFTGFNISAMTWCEEPYKILWVVRGGGVLLSLTSLKSQDVMGWARHDTDLGLYVSATSIIEPPTDALYLVVQRFFPNGTSPYMIERMDDRAWNTVEDCWCVDCGLQLPQPTPAAFITVSLPLGLGQPTNFANLVGGAGYSQSTAVTIADPTGSGCMVTPTIDVTGAITNLAFSGGSGYTLPTFAISDPAGAAGSGFSATVVLTNTATIIASDAVFNSGMVGWVIRAGGGVAQITHYTNSTTVTAEITAPMVQFQRNSLGIPPEAVQGSWTLTQPITTVTGLNHLAGLTVTGLADGNVIPPQTVSPGGTITLASAASSITVGIGFVAQLQSLYLEGGQPTDQGRRKKIGAVTTRVEVSGDFEIGSNQPDGSTQSPPYLDPPWTDLADAALNVPGLAQPPYGAAQIANTTIIRPSPLFTGDVREFLTSGYDKPGQIAVQQSKPLPLQILAFIREVSEGDTPGTDPKTQQGGTRGRAGVGQS